jgi:glycosyltransferase involved in cell wall biosynthesis
MTGIGRYLDRLLESLSLFDTQNQYILFYNALKGHRPQRDTNNNGFSIISTRWPNKMLFKLWAHTSYPPIENLIGPIDVFHAPSYEMPPAKKASLVLTIHDLVFMVRPELASPSAVRDIGPWIKLYANRADIVIADSNSTASDVVHYLGLPPEKVMTVYPGATRISRASVHDVQKAKDELGIKGDFILVVGSLEPRKNVIRLFKAFEYSGLARDFELILAGPIGWRTKDIIETWQSLPCQRRIRRLDYVSEKTLSALYTDASFLAYPSIMEGFGLPILEAMSVGCPVLTSNTSSMPEVAGDAAVYVDPLDIESIAEGLRRLSSDLALRKNLAAAGRRRVSQFTWERTALQMMEIYKKANDMRGIGRGMK